ncbi:MAG TPA: hypothetical protein PLL06_14635 [Acidobacteriota bacterium]|nr:hypothetical protein [Acidobacteriota bacterium]HMZ80935.1 hypothetical protein [Acidobacteriota bacterium]HNG95735.1 hypothetical protein [Acidobacteriota bacterium]HNH81732.1 hypothetical protein [Acidobacteriota bacterium]
MQHISFVLSIAQCVPEADFQVLHLQAGGGLLSLNPKQLPAFDKEFALSSRLHAALSAITSGDHPDGVDQADTPKFLVFRTASF